MLTVILAPVLGVWWLFNVATEDFWQAYDWEGNGLSLIHISEPTRPERIGCAVLWV